jgi:uncharacterized membrane protein
MSPTFTIVVLWLGFAGSHMVMSSLRIRRGLVARLGDGPFLGLYSLVAFAFFVPLVRTYFAHKHAGPLLWSIAIGTPLLWAIYVGMGGAFILMVAGLLRPSPTSIVPGDATPRGAQLLTRHPLFMGLGIFGLLHLIPNGNAADVAFFGGFPVFTVLGCWHQDRRKLATGTAELRGFYQRTPFLPFAGSESARGIHELGRIVIVGGLVVTLVLRYFHPIWFGG